VTRGNDSKRLVQGDVIPERRLTTYGGKTITVPDPEQVVHLQLRRFAGCPICSLHLRSIEERHDKIAAAGVREVVVFHSPPDEFLGTEARLPFDVVADPERRLYEDFGVEPGARAVLDPRAWPAIMRGVSRAFRAVARKEQSAPPNHPRGGRLGRPGDFLIASDGRILACKYGSHAYDQWSVDELLATAAKFTAPKAVADAKATSPVV
jgi:peroxiredoxin